ncbi:MAG TPA: phosphoribosyltransferase [Streptosporangiaceae bacterium]|nr:phosphoribosyltransferase [Streptosporangiaceae bacterium]
MLNQALGRWLLPGPVYRVPHRLTWPQLREQVRAQVPLLSAPQPGMPGLCAVCRGPAGRGCACCFQCDLHRQCAPDSLAATVVPVAFAVKGGPHALNLWQYKSERLRHVPAEPAVPAVAGPAGLDGARAAEPERAGADGLDRARAAAQPDRRAVADAAAGTLLALLLVFLRDHGACVWRSAGITGPTHLAVVPTARSRPGVHPLRALIAPYLHCQWAELWSLPGGHPVRDLDPARFGAAPVPDARVLLLDDTWTTGSTAQSAAMALRRSGARSVAIVVLGRHVSGAGEVDPAAMPFRPESCAVHDDGRVR